MGNLMSSQATPSDMKKYGVSDATIIEDKMLVDKILRKAKEMYDKNNTSFLNEEFCNNVFVAYSKKLYELPIKKSAIEGAYQQLNSDSGDDFKLVIKSRSLDDEKYLISELTGRIVDHFANNKYVSSAMNHGLQLSFPDIKYIQERAIALLDHIDKIEKQKQTGGKSKRKHPLFLDTEGGAFGNNNEENNNENNGLNANNNNENNENNNNISNRNASNARNTGYNANNENNGNANNENNRNNTVKKENMPIIPVPEKPILERAPNGLSKKQRKQWYREQRERESRLQPQNNTNININSEIEKIKKGSNTTQNGPIVKNKNNGANKKENKEENNIFKSLNLGMAPAELAPTPFSAPAAAPFKNEPIKKSIQFSDNRIANFGKLLTNKPSQSPSQPPIQQYQKQPFQPQRQQFLKPQQQPPRQQLPKKESFYIGRMSNEELKHRKNIESSGDRHCTDDALECRLTKKQMCEKITYHFIVVNNLIATIVSVVPFPNESGDNYAGGFMFDRMESLRKGVFCLPPHHSEISAISDDERLHKIFKYINILPKENVSFEETCKRSGGFVLKLSKERMEELGRDEKFGRAYYDFFKKINLFYQEALLNLYNILENLQNNTSISTRRLNELSARTKQIIDELYLKTQFNYLMAVLVILDFDFSKNTKETNAKAERRKRIINSVAIT
jgi:hypothetical protein